MPAAVRGRWRFTHHPLMPAPVTEPRGKREAGIFADTN